MHSMIDGSHRASNAGNPESRSISRKPRLSGLGGLLPILFLSLFVLSPALAGGSYENGSQLKSQQVAIPEAGGHVVGDLGGLSVRIPRYFAEDIEYNGDPGWGMGKPETLSRSSVIRGFGFPVRMPDMAGLSSNDLRGDKRRQSIRTTSWIRVGVTSGEHYPGDGFLDRMVAAIGRSAEVVKYENYQKQPERAFGLTVYSPVGIDPKTGVEYRLHSGARDLFVHRNAAGKVDAYIRCSNRQDGIPMCQHDFDLRPQARVQVNVLYRRDVLAQWSDIQARVRSLILSFQAPKAEGMLAGSLLAFQLTSRP